MIIKGDIKNRYGRGSIMRIALVLPEWRIENPYPPLGLAYIAAVLEKDGYVVKIFDLTLDRGRSSEDKSDDIIGFSPDVIGLSVATHNYHNAIKVASYLKIMTGAYIVFGGPHPTIVPEEILKNDFVDFVIVGEGEETFLKICQNLYTHKFDDIDGICYKLNTDHTSESGSGNIGDADSEKDRKIIVRKKRAFIKNLDNIPFPARHLLPLEQYSLEDDFGSKMATIMTSRGCPYGCIYCYKGIFGSTYRQRSSENIVEEIKQCRDKFGYKSFYFIDDLFTLNAENVEKMTDLLKKENINIRWQCLARVNNAKYSVFKKMKESGCYKIHFGIESGDQNVINGIKKGITLDQVRTAIKMCREIGIKTKGYFMIGMPGDTVDTMNQTLKFASELELDDAMFSVTTPFPGTELWNKIDKSKIESLSDAFYYHEFDDQNFHIFYNLSNATENDIISAMRTSQEISDRIRTKVICEDKFGKKIGFFAWQLSKIHFLRKAGKMFMRV